MAQKLAFKALYRVHYGIPLPIVFKSNAPDSQFRNLVSFQFQLFNVFLFPESERQRIRKSYKRKLKRKAKKERMNAENSQVVASSGGVDDGQGTSVDSVDHHSSSEDLSLPSLAENCSAAATSGNAGTTALSGESSGGNTTTATSGATAAVGTAASNYINYAMPEFAFVYPDSYIKYFDGVAYPAFAVDILNVGPQLLQAETENEVKDPAFQVCDVQVKIGDLGNACWVVRQAGLFFVYVIRLIFCYVCRISTTPRIFKPVNTGHQK